MEFFATEGDLRWVLDRLLRVPSANKRRIRDRWEMRRIDKEYWEWSFTQRMLETALRLDSLKLLFELSGGIETVPRYTPYILPINRHFAYGGGRGDWVCLARVYKEYFCTIGDCTPSGHIYRYLHTSFITLEIRLDYQDYLAAIA